MAPRIPRPDDSQSYVAEIIQFFQGHLTKVEAKLDQLVDITKAQAVLAEQQSRHQDTMADLKVSVSELSKNNATSFERVHKRLDDEVKNRHDAQQANEKECDLKIEAVEKIATNTDNKMEGWVKWGKGVWAAVGIGFVFFGYIGQDFISSYKAEKAETKAYIERTRELTVTNTQQLEKLSTSTANSLEKISTIVSSSVEITRKLDQRLSDTEKQIEFIQQRNKK